MNIGDKLKIYGELSAMMSTDGEQYYMFVDKDGTVSMLPAIGFKEK